MWFLILLLLLSTTPAWSETLSGRAVYDESRGYIGIQFWSDSFNHKLLIRVFPDSPAAKAGLLVDDEIIGIDGRKLPLNQTNGALARLIQGNPGTEVSIQIQRGLKRYSAKLVREDLRDMPKEFQEVAE